MPDGQSPAVRLSNSEAITGIALRWWSKQLVAHKDLDVYRRFMQIIGLRNEIVHEAEELLGWLAINRPNWQYQHRTFPRVVDSFYFENGEAVIYQEECIVYSLELPPNIVLDFNNSYYIDETGRVLTRWNHSPNISGVSIMLRPEFANVEEVVDFVSEYYSRLDELTFVLSCLRTTQGKYDTP